MKKLVSVLSITFSFLALALGTIFLLGSTITGRVVQESTAEFAAPFDYVTGQEFISLESMQITEESFRVSIDVDMPESAIFYRGYYHTDQWHPFTFNTAWRRYYASAQIDVLYDDLSIEDGDDLFVAVWACKENGSSWKCGCKDAEDCGYWYVQGIDITVDDTICVDGDDDGYGHPASFACDEAENDCNDQDAHINPGMTEVPYNGKNDDCNATTPDDDLDGDGYIKLYDCADTDGSIHPGATEVCGNGIDEDCSGSDQTCTQCGEGSIPYTGCRCQALAHYSGFCCDNTYQEEPCGTPEVIFYDGFESGTANTWDYLNPYSSVSSDISHSGAYSLDLRYVAGSEILRRNQYVQTSLPSETQVFFRWYVYFEEDFIHTLEGVRLASMNEVSLNAKIYQGSTNWGRLHVVGNDEEQTSFYFDNDRWYCIETELTTDAGFVHVWVDEESIFSQSGFFSGQIDEFIIGGLYEGPLTITMHEIVDDVVVSTERVGCQ